MTGTQLRKVRERLGWTQAEIAYRLGVTPNTVARWERGEISIGQPTAKLIGRLDMETTGKTYEIRLKDGKVAFLDGITNHSASRSKLTLYRGSEVASQFDMYEVTSWFAPDRVEDSREN